MPHFLNGFLDVFVDKITLYIYSVRRLGELLSFLRSSGSSGWG